MINKTILNTTYEQVIVYSYQNKTIVTYQNHTVGCINPVVNNINGHLDESYDLALNTNKSKSDCDDDNISGLTAWQIATITLSLTLFMYCFFKETPLSDYIECCCCIRDVCTFCKEVCCEDENNRRKKNETDVELGPM